MAQGGDYIGGGDNGFAYSLNSRRKCMNSFFCATDRPFKFGGRINEDVNAYIGLGAIGGLFLTIPHVMLNQKITQTNSGGLTEIYLDTGTYIKSFYTVIANPSCVKVKMMGAKNYRLHHSIKRNNAVPKIVAQRRKKKSKKNLQTRKK